MRSKLIWEALAEHKVTHLCGAPIVMSTILNAPAEEKKALSQKVEFFTAAAPPPEAVLAAMAEQGFNVTHLYGLTETYGPAVVNDWKSDWDLLDGPQRAAKKARQGVRYHALEDLTVMDPETMHQVPADGETMGEVMFRGNIVMKGYLKNPKASAEAFRGRLVPFRRLGRAACRWLYPAQGPLEGHHHFRRREHLVDRGRGCALQAPGDPGGGRGGQARREMGRDALRLRRTETGKERDGGGDHRMVPAGHGALQGAEACGVRRSAEDLTGKIQKFKLRDLAKGV